MTETPETITIRPGPVRRWLWPVLLPLLAGCLLLGAAALWQRQRFHAHDLILLASFAIGAAVLAVQGGVTAMTAARMPEVTLSFSPEGLTLGYLEEPDRIRWPDVEAMGLVRDDWMGQTVGLRLRSYDGLATSLASELDMFRKSRGYDVQIPRGVLDRSVNELLELLDEYLERFGPEV
jgi:hypothetical protein